jgi:hypothetical protein
LTVKGLLVAWLVALGASRLGLWLGNWKAKVKR